MIWVQRSIWVVLTVFSITVLYVVFSGGVVDEDKLAERDRKEAQREAERAGMAYDRFIPGGRQLAPPNRPSRN